MEWLKEATVAGSFAVISAWHWYDKTQRDDRFHEIEKRIVNVETITSKQQTQLEVMNVELKAFSDLTDLRLAHIQISVDKILDRMERKYRDE